MNNIVYLAFVWTPEDHEQTHSTVRLAEMGSACTVRAARKECQGGAQSYGSWFSCSSNEPWLTCIVLYAE